MPAATKEPTTEVNVVEAQKYASLTGSSEPVDIRIRKILGTASRYTDKIYVPL